MKQRKLLSQRHPSLYFLAVCARRLKRRLEWILDNKKYAKNRTEDKLDFRIKKHQSVLLKKLGTNNEQLQINKVTNLKIAAKRINGILIQPGETFSFCKLVGLPTKKKGYLLGMELTFGEARAGIGGGICQISNLIHWLVIHSPLTVTERYHHSFDPFPDDGRVLPFGSGATVFYNYRDYQFTNNTVSTFQLNLWFTDKCLEGELRSDKELDYAYHVVEKEHQFLKIDGQFYRKNEIWRDKILKFQGGKIVETKLITKNFARVTYTPDNYVENEQTEIKTKQTTQQHNHIKLLFRFHSDLYDKEMVETMWATIVNKKRGLYKIDNIPFYVPLLASDDIVFAEFDQQEEMLTYRETIQYSGNSTIQVIRVDKSKDINQIRDLFKALGCTSEMVDGNYFSMEVPATVAYKNIKKKLDELEEQAIIGYAESSLADGHRQ